MYPDFSSSENRLPHCSCESPIISATDSRVPIPTIFKASNTNSLTLIYGIKGDVVKFISDHDNVLIVEHTRTKIRFSVKKSEVNNI